MKMKKLLCLLSLVFAVILAVSAAVWASGEESDKLAVANTVIENGKCTVIGVLKTDELTYSSLTLNVVFRQNGATVKVKTQEFTSVATTITGYASADKETASARNYALIDGYYLVALTVNNVPTGIYEVEAALSGEYTGNGTPETVVSKAKTEKSIIYNGECTPVFAEAVLPTCTTDGHSEGLVCADCGKVLVGCETIPAPGHDYYLDDCVCRRCEEIVCTKGLKIEIEDDHCVVTGYTGSDTYVKIPDKYKGLPVTAIGDGAFTENIKITNVTFPDTLLSIGAAAFFRCNGLTSVILPKKLNSLSIHSFGYCENIEWVMIPLSLETVAIRAFEATNVSSVYYAGTETQWNAIDFQEGNGWLLSTQVYYEHYCPDGKHSPEAVDESPATCETPALSEGVCCSLCNEILVAPEETAPALGHNFVNGFCTRCDVEYYTEGLVFELIDDVYAVFGYTGSDAYVTIPSKYKDVSVKWIDCGAFYECENVVGVKIGEGVTEICLTAFEGCTRLQSISLPKSLKSVWEGAFYGCTGLSDVYYAGSESDWEKVSISSDGNDALLGATVHYDCSADRCPHVKVTVPGYAPTCTEEGLSDKICCLFCNKVLSGGEVLQAKGHDFGNGYFGSNCKDCGISNIFVGNTVTFGNYEQDNDISNGREEIEWIILDVTNGGNVTLVSKYVLMGSTYHTEPDAVTWEESTLYAYLNGEFLNAAFSETEKDAISRARLLDKDEVDEYFPTDADRLCAATAYARASGVVANTDYPTSDGKPSCIRWLMTPGDANEMADVVSADGSYSSLYAVADNIGVRPVISLSCCGIFG